MDEQKPWYEAPMAHDWFPATDTDEKGQRGAVVGRFEIRPHLHAAKSKEQGEKVYEPRIGIHMRAKASSDVSWQQLNPQNAKQLVKRFPEAWDEFQARRKRDGMEPRGKPVSDLVSDENLRWNLLGIGVETVEQLAEADDIRVGMIFGAARMKERAIEMLKPKVIEMPVENAPARRGRPPKLPEPHRPDAA